jgi:hypothetical protein
MPDFPTGPWFWAAWAGAGIVVETLALYAKRSDDTLSSAVQRVVLRGSWWTRATLAGWVAFAAWFAFHIWG